MRAARRMRPDPAPHALDRPVGALLMLRPNEDHWLQLEVNGLSVLIHQAQMARLEAAFAAARGEIEADSYRQNDRLHMQPIRLGRF